MTTIALQKGSAAIPEAKHVIPASSKEEMDAAIDVLDAHKDAWLRVSVDERIALLEALITTTSGQAERWVDAAVHSKGMRKGDHGEGEEWMAGPVVTLRNLRLLARSLADIAKHGTPKLPKPAFTNAQGRTVAPVFPTDTYDELLFGGFSAEVWMQSGVTPSSVEQHQAVAYKQPSAKGRVALVLGAGNVSSIGPMDALHKLFNENQVVVLKMNPVNEYLGPIFEDAFRPLVARGFFKVVYGGAKEGDYLCTHPKIDEIHITGSDKTHDAIVWGLGAEGAERKRNGTPRNTKRITSELGNVSPILVVPGPWSASDLEFQALNVASTLTNNAGFNCNATRVLVTHQGWSEREGFLSALEVAFQQAVARKPYYPGAEDRMNAFLAKHPEAKQFGPRGRGQVPWTLISGLDPAAKDEICFSTEAWCGVTSEVAMPASSVVDFVRKAVDFANDTLWGTLSCSILVHPASLKDPAVAAAVDEAIAKLRFGTVCVNHWAGLGYAFVSTPWGAYPGHPLDDIRSGRGTVHNTYMLEDTEKTVLRGPFRVFPKPAWFFTNKATHHIGRRLCEFYREPSPLRIPKVVVAALGG